MTVREREVVGWVVKANADSLHAREYYGEAMTWVRMLKEAVRFNTPEGARAFIQRRGVGNVHLVRVRKAKAAGADAQMLEQLELRLRAALELCMGMRDALRARAGEGKT